MSKESRQLLKEQRPLPRILPALAQPESAKQGARQKSNTLWLALTSALLLWLCYFPVNAGWLAWVALVPLLCLVRSTARPRTIYLSAWVAGLAFFTVVLQWVRVADWRMHFTWIGLSIGCSLFVVTGVYLIRQLDRRTSLPLLLTVPMVWTGLEFVRAHFLTGFAWYFLAHSQHDFLSVIQISDLGGAYAVSFLIATVNVWIFELLSTGAWFRSLASLQMGKPGPGRRSLAWQSVTVVLMLGGTLAYGGWRLGQGGFEKGPVIALLQGNLDQRLRNIASTPGGPEETIKKVRLHYGELCDMASVDRPDLIVWPETSFLYGWEEVSPELAPERVPEDWSKWVKERQAMARKAGALWQTNLLVGLNAECLEADATERRYNSAILIQKNGQVAGRYDKIHCVAFGEYVPLRDWIPWMKKLAPYDFDYSVTPGNQFTRFPLGKYTFGVIICYEDTDPCLAREYLRSGSGEAAVDFLINISNDGWFNGTSEHDEHLAICRFRAIECRRAVARAVNMGISAFIDGNGRVIDLPGADWEKSKKVEAVLRKQIPIDHRSSLYAQWGDWLPWTCWLVIGGGLVGGFFWPARFSGGKLA